jgi:hypothetical protein
LQIPWPLHVVAAAQLSVIAKSVKCVELHVIVSPFVLVFIALTNPSVATPAASHTALLALRNTHFGELEGCVSVTPTLTVFGYVSPESFTFAPAAVANAAPTIPLFKAVAVSYAYGFAEGAM